MTSNSPTSNSPTSNPSPAQRLKALLADGRPAYGAWNALDSSAVTEALTELGFDWLLIDCEHGLASAESALPLLQGAARSSVAAVVRVPRLDRALIGRLLDGGADGIMVPTIRTADEARMAAAACRYPPAGERGIGPHRASRFYTDGDYLHHANERVFLVLQIETREAVENLEQILAVEGVDAVLIGPADLSAAYGHFGDPRAAAVEEVVATILATAQRAGIAAGYYCHSGKEARQRVEQGFQFVNVGNDFGTLVSGMRRHLRDAHE